MNELKPFFPVEIDTSEKSANISKAQDKKKFCHVPKAN